MPRNVNCIYVSKDGYNVCTHSGNLKHIKFLSFVLCSYSGGCVLLNGKTCDKQVQYKKPLLPPKGHYANRKNK